MKTRRPPRASQPEQPATLDEILAGILKGCGSPERVMELYYWAQSPDMLELLRAIAALPEGTRAVLVRYLTLHDDPSGVTARINNGGEIMLFSPAAAELIRAVSLVQAAGKQVH